jgi:hypothetical protein
MDVRDRVVIATRQPALQKPNPQVQPVYRASVPLSFKLENHRPVENQSTADDPAAEISFAALDLPR